MWDYLRRFVVERSAESASRVTSGFMGRQAFLRRHLRRATHVTLGVKQRHSLPGSTPSHRSLTRGSNVKTENLEMLQNSHTQPQIQDFLIRNENYTRFKQFPLDKIANCKCAWAYQLLLCQECDLHQFRCMKSHETKFKAKNLKLKYNKMEIKNGKQNRWKTKQNMTEEHV